jgi:ubiquitin-protein ligase
MTEKKALYDFNHPIFKKQFIYKRLATEHMDLNQIDSDTIDIQPIRTVGPLKIPNKYLITYHLRTIVGINDDQSPNYGYHHEIEVELPQKYPLESAKIYAKTPVWHPNVQFHGKFKGRVCGNTLNFGKGYGLQQLVFRIEEILKYKNYHAEHTHPFPEDGKVAEWVLEYAEPQGIVNKEQGILTEEPAMPIEKPTIDHSELVEEDSKAPKRSFLKITKPKPVEEEEKSGKFKFKKR